VDTNVRLEMGVGRTSKACKVWKCGCYVQNTSWRWIWGGWLGEWAGLARFGTGNFDVWHTTTFLNPIVPKLNIEKHSKPKYLIIERSKIHVHHLML
jgi:hypothetical protein